MSASAETIRLSRVHYPVTVLGPGRRIGVWVQGCSIGCRGCVARDTWDRAAGRVEAIETLLGWMREAAAQGLDGITISGGEPFEQPVALTSLLRGLHGWRERDALDFDILCYSGFRLARLRASHGDILELLDAVVPEPYMQARPLGPTWQGSDNQPLIALSQRGQQKYAPYLDGTFVVPKALQFAVDDSSIWFIGIPARGDMDRLEALARAQGLTVENTSWSSSNTARIAAGPTSTSSA